MLTVKDDNGIITVHDWEEEEEFSIQLIEFGKPFIDMSQGRITITASNGRWVYRPIGWNRWNTLSVRAVLESYEVFYYVKCKGDNSAIYS